MEKLIKGQNKRKRGEKGRRTKQKQI